MGAVRRFIFILSFVSCVLTVLAQDTRTGFRARPVVPGDQIELSFIGSESPPIVVLVQTDGSVSVPYVGPMTVGGATLPDCTLAIEKALRATGVTSQISVRRVTSPSQPISFRGAFRKAGQVQPWPDAVLEDLLGLASPTERADLEQVEIWSIEGDVYTINALPNAPGRKTKLRAGDAIFVPELKVMPQITVLGAVAKPGVVVFSPGMTAKQAIEAVGGVLNRADITKIRIERDKKQIDTINLELNYDAPLKAGDVVLVPMKPEPQFVTINGAVKKQGLLDFREGMTLSEAVKNAGGTVALADLAQISIMRRVNGALTRQKVDLNKIRAGKQADIVLQANDIIDIPIRKATGPATQPPPTGGGGSMEAAL